MLKLDLARSSEELVGDITERCSTLGQVMRVSVYRARSKAPARPFAIVSMAQRSDAERVAATLGGRTVGHAVVVFIEPTVDPAPTQLRAAAARPDQMLGSPHPE